MPTYNGPHEGCVARGLHAHAMADGSGPVLEAPPYERVDHPAHYNRGIVEHVEYAEDRGWAQGYCLGNATKYIHRAGSKPGSDALEDLRKAKWYLDRYIAWLEHGPLIWRIQKKDAAEGRATPAKVETDRGATR